MKLLSIIFILSLTLISCVPPAQTIKIKAESTKNDVPEVIAGENLQNQTASKTLVFRRAGDMGEFRPGEVVQIVSEGVDFLNYTFSFISDQETEKITMVLVPRANCKIELSKKCQVITWSDPSTLPTIVLADNLKPEQIVFTPLFNDNCERTGYQVRYGSAERGCYKEAKDVLKSFNKCAEKGKVRKITSDIKGAFIATKDPIPQ